MHRPPQSANSRWENGSLGQTLLEWKYPDLSVFAATAPLPLPPLTGDQIPDIVSMARDTLGNRPRNFINPALPHNSSSSAAPTATGGGGEMQRRQGTPTSAPVPSGTGSPAASSSSQALNVPILANAALPRGQPLLDDGAAGDPPSVGVTVLVADKASGETQVNGVTFMQAAQSQVDYLLYGVPRVSRCACWSIRCAWRVSDARGAHVGWCFCAKRILVAKSAKPTTPLIFRLPPTSPPPLHTG